MLIMDASKAGNLYLIIFSLCLLTDKLQLVYQVISVFANTVSDFT